MLFTSVLAEMETPVMVEEMNDAVSAEPLGTVAGDQLPAVFQSPVAGRARHVALPARAGETKSAVAMNGMQILEILVFINFSM
jgi:hypothetical protein